jgi:hypothetical protein
MVGPDAPEIMQGMAVVVKAGLTKAQFDATARACQCHMIGARFALRDA